VPGKTHLQHVLLCVKWDVKPYTLTHSLNTVLTCVWKLHQKVLIVTAWWNTVE